MFKSPRLSLLALVFFAFFAFQVICRDSSGLGALENEHPDGLLSPEASAESKEPPSNSERAGFGTPKKSLKGNIKFENPKELEEKLKYRREKFNTIVGFPIRLVLRVFYFIFSVFQGIFNFIKGCFSWTFFVTYWVFSKLVLLLYTIFLLNPYKFLRYLYFQYGTLIFFCSLPVMFGTFGGIFFATLSEGTLQLISLYFFPKEA